MKKIYFAAICSLWALSTFAQTPFVPYKGTLLNGEQINKRKISTVGPLQIGTTPVNTVVPPPPEYVAYVHQLAAKARGTAATATFVVTYTGFTNDAKTAFQAAVDIWSTQVSSIVPIRVKATWTPLTSTRTGSTLGQAYPYTFVSNFNGAPLANISYPIALAERISRQSLNPNTDPDIGADFNSDETGFNWFYNTTGVPINPKTNQIDLTSVVLHELCHGLGFTDSFAASTTGTIAAYGGAVGYTDYATPYDYYLENNAGQRLINTNIFKNPSASLYTQVTSDSLFFNGPATIKVNGERAKLSAPKKYVPGSQIAHLDEAFYPAGSLNSLMTTTLANGEIDHNPGPIVKAIMADMGWKTTSVLHANLGDTEDRNKALVFNASVYSDTSVVSNSVKLVYTETPNDTLFTKAVSVPLKLVSGKTNDYTTTLAATGKDRTILYYISATDGTKTTYTNPPQAPTNYYIIKVADDKTPPYLEYYPNSLITSKDTVSFIALSYDNLDLGIDSVYVNYTLNGVAKPKIKIPSRFDLQQDIFYLQSPFGKLNNGDRYQYNIVAVDKAKARNKTTLPSDGTFYQLVVADPKTTPVVTYTNNFDAASTDFAGSGFSITTPSGFSNGGIHSDHPYTNGAGADLTTNRIMKLLQPITVQSTNAKIKFDEIVLVEPNDAGGTFAGGENSGFYDFVSVEGSKDGGKTWATFLDGYNCRANNIWLNTWNSNLVTDTKNSTLTQPVKDSRANGTPALALSREIDMLASGNFKAGDQVLIRFRLFSDQLVNGWGWAIDNLQIQVAPVTAVTEIVETKDLLIYPNPSPNEMQVKVTLKQAGKVQLDIVNLKGAKIMTQDYTADTVNFTQKVDLKNLSSGVYLVRLSSGDSIFMKKIVIEK